MKKAVFYALLVFVLFGCRADSVINAESIGEKPANNKVGGNSEQTKSLDSNKDMNAIKTDAPLLWGVQIKAADLSADTELDVSSFDENHYEKPPDKTSPYYAARNGVEVDLMNCGGYLGRGLIYASNKGGENSTPEWKIKIVKEKSAADAGEKIKRCNVYSEGDEVLTEAFAVAPARDERRGIKIENADTKKIFASLPTDIKKWANSDVNLSVWKREKDDLTLQHDKWTDLDGDGEIDLVLVFAYTDEEHGSGTILLKTNGKWNEIAAVIPA